MSNNAFLFATRTPDACVKPYETEKLLWVGPNMIPVLWMGAFQPSDFVSVIRDDLETYQLFAPITRALTTYRKFLSGIRSSPRAVRSLDTFLSSFEERIASASAEGLQLDDFELQCMVGPQQSQSWLTKCLCFVEDVAQGRLSGDAIFLNSGALEIFDQAQVNLKTWSTHIGWEASLVGYAEI